MNLLVPIALFGWVPVVIGLFAVLPPRRAAITSSLVGWLFLPTAGYSLPGIPDYTKVSATCVGILLGAAIFDTARLLSFRPRLIDLPMLAWCLCPFASRLSNDLGVYDALSGVTAHVITWGIPYFIGRLYLSSREGLRDLAIGIFVGGLIYVPLCLYENRMSPQLGRILYGRSGRAAFYGSFDVLGWQPKVFMQNALALTMFMASATVMGAWLWASGALKRLWGVSLAWLVPPVLFTTILCKSLGGISLAVLGVAMLFLTKWSRSYVPLLCLVVAPPLYMTLRATNRWSGEQLLELARPFGTAREHNLQVRLDNEDVLAELALQRPILGWGGWGRARPRDEEGRRTAIVDGLWIITFGDYGTVGLVAITVVLLLPAVALMWRFPARLWMHPSLAPTAALAVVLALYMIDNLFNAMLNPIFILAAGGVCGLCSRRATPQSVVRWTATNSSRRVPPQFSDSIASACETWPRSS